MSFEWVVKIVSTLAHVCPRGRSNTINFYRWNYHWFYHWLINWGHSYYANA